MSSCWRIFSLEWKALTRGRTLAILSAAAVAWVVATPWFVRGDGTEAGTAEVLVKYSLGGAAAIVAVSMVTAAAGTLAKERERKTLQLTLVRPVNAFAIVMGRIAALSLCAAVALAAAFCAHLAVHGPLFGDCSHVLYPIMPSPEKEAREMYDMFMADPRTPEEVKKAPRNVVLRLLAQRAVDRFEAVPPDNEIAWRFAAPECEGASARIRFSNMRSHRQDASGELKFGAAAGSVGDLTDLICVFPLDGRISGEDLVFRNTGKETLLMRPRRDVQLLLPADGFTANFIRSYLQLCIMMTIMIAFAAALSAGLSRPVAVFTVLVLLAVGEMSPSVIDRYPDELETSRLDAIGLAVSRAVAEAAHPVESLNPIVRLAEGEAVEWTALGKSALTHLLAVPALLAVLAAFVMRRKGN